MRARLTKLGVAVAALAALAVGGATLASGGGKPAPPAVVQSQPAIDNPGEAQAGVDGDNVQQGDQSTPDNPAEIQGETSSESASESGPSDGPGGYADSNASADTQQQGEH